MDIAGKLGKRLFRLILENLVETAAMRAGTVIGRAVGERVAKVINPGNKPKIRVVDLTKERRPAKGAPRARFVD